MNENSFETMSTLVNLPTFFLGGGRVNWGSFFHIHKFPSPHTIPLQKFRPSVTCVEATLYPKQCDA